MVLSKRTVHDDETYFLCANLVMSHHEDDELVVTLEHLNLWNHRYVVVLKVHVFDLVTSM